MHTSDGRGGMNEAKHNEHPHRVRAARLLMDREPAMSQDEALLIQATQQDMLQLS